MRISVFGLGYVGAVTGACLAESGHEVIAVDIDPAKVDRINAGRSPILEPGLTELIERTVKSGRFGATLDGEDAMMKSELSLICVGTPGQEDGSVDLSHIEGVCRTIGAALKNKKDYHVIATRSAVVPGSSRDVLIPALEKASGKKCGVAFGYGVNPEFLREGSAIEDYFKPPKIVIGASDERAGDVIAAMHQDIAAPEARTSIEIAEGVKYACNAWHAMKVGFANELGNILKEHGVDSHKVMEIFFLDKKLNISEAYLTPGFAFGGSCLPKDVRALRAGARKKGLKTPLFDGLLEANDAQVRRAREMVKKTGLQKIGLLGLSFKAGTDDVRESPLVTLANSLIEDGFEISIYDPGVAQSASINHMPRIAERLAATADEFLEKSDLFIIGNSGAGYGDLLSRAEDDKPVIDLVRLKNSGELEKRKNYGGICW